MNKIRRSAPAKVAAVFAMLVATVFLVAGTIAAGIRMSSEQKSAVDYYLGHFVSGQLWELVDHITYARETAQDELPLQLPARLTDKSYTNLRYEVRLCSRENPDGQVILRTIDESEKLQGTRYYAFAYDSDEFFVRYSEPGCSDEQELQWILEGEHVATWYIVRVSLPEVLTCDDMCGPVLSLLRAVFFISRSFLPVLACSGAVLLAGFCFLLYAAGWRGRNEQPVCGVFDKIPFDLLLAVWGLLTALLLDFIFCELWDGRWYELPILAAILFWVLLPLPVTMAVRLRTKTLFSGMLTMRSLRCVGRFIAESLRCLRRILPASAKLILVWLAVCAAQLLLLLALLSSYAGEELIFLAAVCFDLLLLAGLLYLWDSFRRVSRAAAAVGAGNTQAQIDKKMMPPFIRTHADEIEHIADGLSRAVDEKLRSERMKTELITNVSHDIKTPLTSIINYVDLLSKTDPREDAAREYIEVLSRQSARLKKLIEDLIEVSKASSGNLQLHREPCNLQVLLGQVCGEYEEKYRQTGLQPVLRMAEEPCVIRADGRYMWRILDNILGNARKYAQPGTRVYISLEKTGGDAIISCKNISREELNICAEELLERFVRGDGSRHTEGSGLGLSIASSLTRLQDGALDISVDGDLFKVILRFPLM